MAGDTKILHAVGLFVLLGLLTGFRQIQVGTNAEFRVTSIKPVQVKRVSILAPSTETGAIREIAINYRSDQIVAELLLLNSLHCRSIDVIPDVAITLESGDLIECKVKSETSNVIFILEADYND